MCEFKNGETVYWDHKSAYYIGEDPYDQTWSYVVDIHSGEVGTIHTEVLSRTPPMSQRELNGKALFELLEPTWCEISGISGSIDWVGGLLPENKEVFIRLAEKLNYTAGDEP